MASFSTGDLKNLPRNIADGLVKKAQTGSVLAQLSGAEAQRFGNHDIITLNGSPRAEFVTEGAEKGSSGISYGVVTAEPRKAQVTLRFNQEVLWADQDYQLGVLSEVADEGAVALSRALDLGAIHSINPLTGSVIAAWTNRVSATSKSVTEGADPELDLEAAIGLLMSTSDVPNAIAFDPTYAWKLATSRYSDGRKKFPDMPLTSVPGNALGLRAATGNTVSGAPEAAAATGIKAIVGDFERGFRWGVQRQLPIELIQYGDPDGDGDLKRKNQIALRLEVVYGWYVFTDKFVKIVADEEDEG